MPRDEFCPFLIVHIFHFCFKEIKIHNCDFFKKNEKSTKLNTK